MKLGLLMVLALILTSGCFQVEETAQEIKTEENKSLENLRIINYDSGEITRVVLPPELFVGNDYSLNVELKNTKNTSWWALFDIFVNKDNETIRHLDGGIEVEPLLNAVYEAGRILNTDGLTGEYELKILANIDGVVHSKLINYTVIDDEKPVITNVSFYHKLVKNNPLFIEVDVLEISEAEGFITVKSPDDDITEYPLPAIIKGKEEKLLWGLIYNTGLTGLYEFNVTVCDIFDNCATSENMNFEVGSCNKTEILFVSDWMYDNVRIPKYVARILENDYCVSRWEDKYNVIAKINKSYLDNFKIVIWRGKLGIEKNDTIQLEKYVSGGGKTVLIGGDIAYKADRDNYEDFLKNITHSIFDEDLILTDVFGKPTENISIRTSGEHPITKGLNNIDYDPKFSQFPDSIKPIDGISLLEWSSAKSATVVYEDPEKGPKSVFFPFELVALNETVRDQLLLNSVRWLDS